MSYLVREMWAYLAVAMLGSGVLVTWLARAYFSERLERAEQNWKTRSRALEDGANTKLRDVEQGYTEQLEQNASQLSALTTDLQSQRARVSSLGDETSKWRTDFEELEVEHESTVARLRTLDDRLAVALEDSDQLDLERKRLRGELERRGSELTKAIEETSRLAEADQHTDELQARAVALEAKTEALNARTQELNAEIDALNAKTQELQGALDRTTQTVGEREERIRELNPLEDEIREAREELELLQREYSTDVTRREEESTRLRSRVGELEPMAARVVVLGGQLSERTATLTSLESQLAALSGFPDRLRASEEELSRAREGTRELEADVARLRGELERAKRQPAATPSKTSNGGRHMSDVRELVRDVVEGRETQARHNGPNLTRAKDDLKRITGIGAKLESRLHGLGYLTYRQIASWSQEDIDRVEHHLPGFPDRIRRDNWIGQARQLDDERKGDGASI